MKMTQDSDQMTRRELIDWHVSQGVAKWGESERAGLERQAARKSLATLRGDYDLALEASDAMSASEVMRRAGKRETGPVQYQAMGCLDDGPT